MPFSNLAYASERREERHEVHHRTRAVRSGGDDALHLTIVNISPNGLMARCDEQVDPGMRLHIRLPDVGAVHAEVRWALGGRIGCEFQHSIPPAAYYALLPRLT
jgi:hypothetical protein